jgi:hypothetical protein
LGDGKDALQQIRSFGHSAEAMSDLHLPVTGKEQRVFHPVTAELAVQEHNDRVRKAEQKAALLHAVSSTAAPPAPVSGTFDVRGFVGSLFIGLGVWIQGSKARNAPVSG